MVTGGRPTGATFPRHGSGRVTVRTRGFRVTVTVRVRDRVNSRCTGSNKAAG